MAGVKVTVTRNRFPEMPSLAREAIGRALSREGADVLIDMQNQTPVESGDLLRSETVEVTENRLTLSAGRGLPDARALFVHEGTHRLAARPFMRQALEGASPDIAAAIGQELETGLA